MDRKDIEVVIRSMTGFSLYDNDDLDETIDSILSRPAEVGSDLLLLIGQVWNQRELARVHGLSSGRWVALACGEVGSGIYNFVYSGGRYLYATDRHRTHRWERPQPTDDAPRMLHCETLAACDFMNPAAFPEIVFELFDECRVGNTQEITLSDFVPTEKDLVQLGSASYNRRYVYEAFGGLETMKAYQSGDELPPLLLESGPKSAIIAAVSR